MSDNSKAGNINNYFFEGHYKDLWRQIFPEKTTKAEVDFIIESGSLISGNCVLDLMCGYGRHALELAARGMEVTAVDNLESYVDEITEKAEKNNLNINAICADVMALQLTTRYDAAICMGNSLQFFNQEDNQKLLGNVSDHMKPGGKFFINSWSLAEIVLQQFREKSWTRIGEAFLLTQSRILENPTRMETNSIIITESGEKEEKAGIDFIYTVQELETMLNQAGFRLIEIFSIPGKKLFIPGDPRAYIIAEKI